MPPRGVYKARQQERTRKADRRARPAQESRSDQRQRERQERERVARESKARLAKALASKKIKKSPQHAFAEKLGRSPVRDPRDTQDHPSGTSAVQRWTTSTKAKINNAVTTTSAKAQMSPPISKPKSPTKFTISGGVIKGGTIYKDEITGSTLAGRDTRVKAFSDPKSVKVVGSRTGSTLLQARPDMDQTTLYNTQQKISANNKDVVDNLTDPSRTKIDLLTKTPIKKTPTLLSNLRKKKDRKGMSGGNFWSAMIRTLLG